MYFDKSTLTTAGNALLTRLTAGDELVWGRAACFTDTLTDAGAATTTSFSGDCVCDGNATASFVAANSNTGVTATMDNTAQVCVAGYARCFGLWAKIDGDADWTLLLVAYISNETVAPPTYFPAYDGSGETLLRAVLEMSVVISDGVVTSIQPSSQLYALASDLQTEINTRTAFDSRCVTTHAASSATTGESQNIYGTKHFQNGIGFKESSLYCGGIYGAESGITGENAPALEICSANNNITLYFVDDDSSNKEVIFEGSSYYTVYSPDILLTNNVSGSGECSIKIDTDSSNPGANSSQIIAPNIVMRTSTAVNQGVIFGLGNVEDSSHVSALLYFPTSNLSITDDPSAIFKYTFNGLVDFGLFEDIDNVYKFRLQTTLVSNNPFTQVTFDGIDVFSVSLNDGSSFQIKNDELNIDTDRVEVSSDVILAPQTHTMRVKFTGGDRELEIESSNYSNDDLVYIREQATGTFAIDFGSTVFGVTTYATDSPDTSRPPIFLKSVSEGRSAHADHIAFIRLDCDNHGDPTQRGTVEFYVGDTNGSNSGSSYALLVLNDTGLSLEGNNATTQAPLKLSVPSLEIEEDMVIDGGDILPESNNLSSIGSSLLRFKNIYANYISANSHIVAQYLYGVTRSLYEDETVGGSLWFITVSATRGSGFSAETFSIKRAENIYLNKSITSGGHAHTLTVSCNDFEETMTSSHKFILLQGITLSYTGASTTSDSKQVLAMLVFE